ncbi:MAG TPA: hypothetical protein VD695_04375 [Gaiellaceae bacterium]|nr:hypothetical protein [Gaiellaceae bacterium]HXV95764.1 hypothetical protein [Gaiellaceae bacterium]
MELPLLLHILGASILVGGLITALSFQLVGWARETPAGAAMLARYGFLSLLVLALPGWILMRAGAQWIWSEQGWDDVRDEPGWLDIGWFTGDLGLPVILVTVILAGLGARRLRQSGGTTSSLVRGATALTAIMLIANVVTVWAMSAKPD